MVLITWALSWLLNHSIQFVHVFSAPAPAATPFPICVGFWLIAFTIHFGIDYFVAGLLYAGSLTCKSWGFWCCSGLVLLIKYTQGSSILLTLPTHSLKAPLVNVLTLLHILKVLPFASVVILVQGWLSKWASILQSYMRNSWTYCCSSDIFSSSLSILASNLLIELSLFKWDMCFVH